MTKLVILGHGGYGTAMKRNLGMLIGEQPDFYYIDFNEQDELQDLQKKIQDTIAEIGDAPILFCCDLAGGSPFREAAAQCLTRPDYCCVAGVNTTAYAEVSFHLDMSAAEVGKMACEVAKEAIVQFPEPVE